MSDQSKKELRENYKSREIIGGIFSIQCTPSKNTWIKSTKDLNGQKNKFDFAKMTNSCLDPSMQKDWNQYGAQSFTFTILEELKKGELQTERDFKNDLQLLHEIWLEKMKSQEN